MFDSETTLKVKAQTFDPQNLDPEFLENPYSTYELLRNYDPIHVCPDGSIFLTRYADVNLVYRDARFSSDKKLEFRPKFGDSPLYTHHTTSLVFNDPPLHSRVRKLLMPAFTPRALKALEIPLLHLIENLLDKLEEEKEFDLISDFAAAIPVQVIGDLLTIPFEERGPLREWSLSILSALEPKISNQVFEKGNKSVSEFSSYLEGLIRQRSNKPLQNKTDVLSALIKGHDNEKPLTMMELVHNCIFILNAGHETTTNLIGNGIAALVDNPVQLALLRDDPERINSAVEEFLRYESSNQLGNRRALQDVKIGEVPIASGSLITLCIGAANRDPKVFFEPEKLDILRSPNPHLAFGSGVHTCAGMSLARMEAR